MSEEVYFLRRVQKMRRLNLIRRGLFPIAAQIAIEQMCLRHIPQNFTAGKIIGIPLAQKFVKGIGYDFRCIVTQNLGQFLKLPDVVLSDSELTRKQRYEMLRRSKMLLSMRRADDEVAKRLERRKEWNIARLPVIQNNLDLFPAVKYSYSSRRPDKREISLVISDGGKVRFDGLIRSDNMRLDPVDAPRIAYKKRKEIQRALQWGYDNGIIPVMLTFTIFHDWTWQPLEKLIAVLRSSYDDMFDHSVGEQLRNKIGFKYRIFRMEETIDMKNSLAVHDENGKF